MRLALVLRVLELLAYGVIVISAGASIALQIWFVFTTLGWFEGSVALVTLPLVIMVGALLTEFSWGDWRHYWLPVLLAYGFFVAAVGSVVIGLWWGYWRPARVTYGGLFVAAVLIAAPSYSGRRAEMNSPPDTRDRA